MYQMYFTRRALLYFLRKKGRTFGMILLIAIVSTLIICCFAILNTAQDLTLEIRKSVGAAFYIRANTNVVADDKGGISIEKNEVHITEDDIANIEKCGDTAYCNPVNYGYAKSEGIQFILGEQDDSDSCMGQVTALSYSALYADFADGVVALSDGRHITGMSEKSIMISAEAAAISNLSVGDKVILKSAEFGMEEGKYTDVWHKDRKEIEVSIIGIYDILSESLSEAAATAAAKQANRIYASLDVLQELGESEPSVYTGEVDFYVIDPAGLAEMIPKVRQIKGIDWNTHFIRTNDFRYSHISDSMKSLGSLIKILLVCISVVSAAVLTLVLTLGIRNRIHESGIYLAIGVSKGEVLMQFLLETSIAAILAFAFSYAIFLCIQGSLADSLFGDFQPNLILGKGLESGADDFLKSDIHSGLKVWETLAIYICQFFVIAVSVVISSLAVLRLQPKEILMKMS